MNYEVKDLKFFIKAESLTDEGVFEGLAAVYGNVDLGGDVIEPGAFTKSLADRKNEVPILWQHDHREPIGVGTLTDTPQGLKIRGELVLESSQARAAFALMKRRALKGLSIGYELLKHFTKGPVKHLTEIAVREVSLVTFPMNERALVSVVKAEDGVPAIELKRYFDQLCKQIRN
jgi:uncharacterized protein